MPWSVEGDHASCPASRPWAVVKDDDGSVAGCHATKADAEKQQAALYAQEDSMSAEMKFVAPRDDLIRGLAEIRSDGNGNTMYGYAIVFNQWTTIDSWEGKFRERIHPGAVTKTLKERGDQVKVQFDHGMHPVIGSFPIAKPKVQRVDDIGLYAEDELSMAHDVQTLIKPRILEGSIDGQSFRFSVKRDEWDKEDTDMPERTILELALFERGPVTWPAYEATQVGIRGQAAFAAWMQQTPEERAATMRQFDLAPRREIIRVRSGAVEVDTSDEQHGEEARDGDPADGGEPADGHSPEEQRDEPADDGHSSIDTPADDGHLSSPEEIEAPARAERERMTDDERASALAAVKAALERDTLD